MAALVSKVSRICLGCMSYGVPPSGPLRPGSNAWSLNEEQSQPFFRQALDGGINFFDTANVYSNGDSERVLGRFLKAHAKREDVVIATKLNGVMRDGPNGGGLSRKEIFFEIDESLRRLGTDYVDLYQIHRWDRTTPIEETLQALDDLVRAGKVRYLGASAMWAWQFSKALYLADRHGWSRFVTMQPHYNLLYREEEREMLPLCLDQGIGVMPWSPLARGKLARPWDAEATKRSETDGYAKSLYRKRGGRPSRSGPRSASWPPRAEFPVRSLPWPGCSPGRQSPRPSSAQPSRITSRTPSPPSR